MVAAMIYNILLISPRIKLIVSWAFYMEGKRIFEGNRTLITNYNLYLPILNAFKLLSKLESKRLSIEINNNNIPLNCISTINSNIQLLLISHVDDYTFNDNQNISIIFNNIQLKTVLVKHYRVDSNNNNIYSEWIKMGKPEYLNDQQLIYFKNYQQLKLLNPPVQYQIQNNKLVLPTFTFSTHSIDFFEIINQT
jgi:beta-xylosidase